MPVGLNVPKQPIGRGSAPKPITGRTVFFWIAGFFGLIFAANAVLVWFAFDSWTGLEVESSYTAGQQFGTDQQAARAQEKRKWTVDVKTDRAEGGLAVTVNPVDKAGAPVTGLEFSVHLSRPTASQLDKRRVMIEAGRGVYKVRFDVVQAGQWDIRLSGTRDGKRLFHSRNRIVLD